MKKIFLNLTFVFIASSISLHAVAAQENRRPAMPETYPAAQVEAMKKINFLVGKWRGRGWALGFGGKRENFTINESVEYRLGNLVAVIEGLGKSKDETTGTERVTHNAFAVLSYEPQAKTYRWRAHSFYGTSLDLTAEIGDKTLVWGFKIPQFGDTRYTITINEKGNWFEIGEASRDGGKTWTKILEMELEKVK